MHPAPVRLSLPEPAALRVESAESAKAGLDASPHDKRHRLSEPAAFPERARLRAARCRKGRGFAARRAGRPHVQAHSFLFGLADGCAVGLALGRRCLGKQALAGPVRSPPVRPEKPIEVRFSCSIGSAHRQTAGQDKREPGHAFGQSLVPDTMRWPRTPRSCGDPVDKTHHPAGWT